MFKKNDLVTVINLWSNGVYDSKSKNIQFTVDELEVHSCGKKQMILRTADGEVFKRRNYLPQTEQYSRFHQVHPRMDRAEAIALADRLTREYCKEEIARYEHILDRSTDPRDGNYRAVIQKGLDHYRTYPLLPAKMYERRI